MEEFQAGHLANISGLADRPELEKPQSLSAVKHLGSPELNKKLCEEQYQYGKTVLETLPSILTFTLTTFCNYKTPCLICDRNVRPESADSKMSEEVFNAAMPLLKTADLLYLHCGGEPMLSQNFDDVIDIVNLPTKVAFNTNAMLLTNKRSDIFLDKANIIQINVSLDAATENMYKVMRPHGDFNKILDNLNYLLRKRETLNIKIPKIDLHMTICQENLSDVPAFADMAADLGADIISYNHLNSGLDFTLNTIDGRRWDYKEQATFDDPAFHDEMVIQAYEKAKSRGLQIIFIGNPFIGPNIDEIDESIKSDLKTFLSAADNIPISKFHKNANNGRPHCVMPWNEAVIQPNGDVRLCCFHDIAKYKLGNILDSDFMEIWNSELMVKERENAYQNSFASMCYASEPCYYREAN